MPNKAAQALGRMGGKVSSEAKTLAAQKNGRKGGRPRKKKTGEPVQSAKNPEAADS